MGPDGIRGDVPVQRLGQSLRYTGHEEVFVYADRFQAVQSQKQLNLTFRTPLLGLCTLSRRRCRTRRHGHLVARYLVYT